MKNWNRLKGLLLAMLLVLSPGMTVLAENDQKVVDMADLLSAEEEQELMNQLQGIAQTYQVDVAAATSDTCGSQSPQDYTDDFYYQNGYGYGENLDGIILMICMDERQFHLATRGAAIDIFTDYGLERIDELITPYLSDGEYAEAFSYYGKLAELFIEEYTTTGEAFDTNKPFEEEMGIGTRLIISVVIGLVAALITWLVLLGQLKSVAPERKAQEYVRNGSFRITKERDIYLYKNVSKRKVEKDSGGGSSTHRTSDGGRAGGRTGSF